MKTGVSVVLMTVPDEEKAASIARTLVEENLIACANVIPQVRSIYRWEGKVRDEREVLLVLKAPSSGFAALQVRILALHPYTVPEVLRLEVADGHPEYLRWVLGQDSQPTQAPPEHRAVIITRQHPERQTRMSASPSTVHTLDPLAIPLATAASWASNSVTFPAVRHVQHRVADTLGASPPLVGSTKAARASQEEEAAWGAGAPAPGQWHRARCRCSVDGGSLRF